MTTGHESANPRSLGRKSLFFVSSYENNPSPPIGTSRLVWWYSRLGVTPAVLTSSPVPPRNNHLNHPVSTDFLSHANLMPLGLDVSNQNELPSPERRNLRAGLPKPLCGWPPFDPPPCHMSWKHPVEPAALR